jgi:Ca2+:H+ antiporter
VLTRSDRLIIGSAGVLTLIAGVLNYAHLSHVVTFIVAGIALAALAALVGRSVEQVADRLGSGATGVVQSALGNLPELFVCIFALRDGLVTVVQAAIIGSILSNVLLVLGLAFVAGGLEHGRQSFDPNRARNLIALMILAVAAMLVPSLAHYVHSPAAHHEHALSVIASIVLLAVFAMSVPSSLRRGEGEEVEEPSAPLWPTPVAITTLAATGVLAALVSDWFVAALQPALGSLHITQAFAGLVIVAIAGNAVENATGVVLALRGKADLAVSVVTNSVAQITAFLFPALVLASLFFTTRLTFQLAPVFIGALALTGIALWQITSDGEATPFEGTALGALYTILAVLTWYE